MINQQHRVLEEKTSGSRELPIPPLPSIHSPEIGMIVSILQTGENVQDQPDVLTGLMPKE